MRPIQLQVGITLDQATLATVTEILTAAIEKGTARQVEAVATLADQWMKRTEPISPPPSPVAVRMPVPTVEHSSPHDPPMLLSVNDVSKMLNVSARTVWTLRDSRSIPMPMKIGSLVRWSREDIANWIRTGGPTQNRRQR